MDPITHGLLGATIARAGFTERLGRRAAWWAAGAAMLPDLDVFVPGDEFSRLVVHRGETHALWFGPALGPLLGWAIWRWTRKRSGAEAAGPLGPWMLLMALAMLSHPLLDVCTTWGTQLLAPFSRARFAIDSIAILDPFFTLVLVAGLLFGRRPRTGTRIARAALALAAAYLAYGLALNAQAERQARAELAATGVQDAEVQAYPTMLQLWLRRIVARTPGEVRVGYLSLWKPHPISWQSFRPPQHPIIEDVRSTPEGQRFEWFAMHQTSPRLRELPDGWLVEIDDLRYGMPGAPERGFWAVRAEYGPDLVRRGPVQRIRHPRGEAGAGEILRMLWQKTFRP